MDEQAELRYYTESRGEGSTSRFLSRKKCILTPRKSQEEHPTAAERKKIKNSGCWSAEGGELGISLISRKLEYIKIRREEDL